MTIPELDQWLLEATRGLCREDRLRIHRELHDHVQEAREEHLFRGLDEEAAITEAVVGLGDPSAAGRAFRRTNLRPWEAHLVGDLGRPKSRVLQALYLAVIPIFAFTSWRSAETVPSLSLLLLLLALMVTGYLSRFWLPQHFVRQGLPRRAVFTDLFGSWLYYIPLLAGSALVSQAPIGWPMRILFISVILAMVVLYAHLLPKVFARSTPEP